MPARKGFPFKTLFTSKWPALKSALSSAIECAFILNLRNEALTRSIAFFWERYTSREDAKVAKILNFTYLCVKILVMSSELTFQVRALRKGRNLTQAQLGILSGMSKSQICRIEKGEIGSQETVSRLLSAMGYEIHLQIVDKYLEPGLNKESVLDMLGSYFKSNSDRLGIEKLGLFGSFSRGEQTPESDIDVCIRLRESSLYKLSSIRLDLESIFKRDVDLVTLPDKMDSIFFGELQKDVIYVQR